MKISLIMRFLPWFCLQQHPLIWSLVSRWILGLFPKNCGSGYPLKRQRSSKWNHENQSCFDEDTVDLVMVVEIKKVIDSFADSASNKRKGDRLVCRFSLDGTKRWLTHLPIWPCFWKWKGYWLVCQLNLEFENEKDIDSFADKRWVTRLPTQPRFRKWKGYRLICQ